MPKTIALGFTALANSFITFGALVLRFSSVMHPDKSLEWLATPFDVGANFVFNWRIRKNEVPVPKSDLISFEDSL